jgi:hypothetical protein
MSCESSGYVSILRHSIRTGLLWQELACNDDHHTHWRELFNKLQSPAVKIPDKLRLGLLYVLRYEH